MSDHTFVISWDENGLEYVEDVTAYEQSKIWAVLTDSEGTQERHVNLNHLILRARFNTQRHYEIYIVTAKQGITKENIEEMFEVNPQGAADTIRRLGHTVYSNRRTTDGVKII